MSFSDNTAAANWRQFVSPGLGLVLSAPDSFEDQSDDTYFQVVEPATGTAFTAAAYAGPDMDLPGWAQVRLGGVLGSMPFLRQVSAPRRIAGGCGDGMLAEYEGQFEGATEPSRYLVLCFLIDNVKASFTATIPVSAWHGNEDFYRRIVTERLQRYEVRTPAVEGSDLAGLEAAAAGGDSQAQFVLAATLAQRADGGAPGAAAASFGWYGRAAEQGHVDAQVALGICYANGWGCVADPGQAARWWAAAAGQGSADGHFYLAVAYSQGFGLDASDVEAARHCRIAADLGHEQAREQLGRLG
jgi:hypothetical protein